MAAQLKIRGTSKTYDNKQFAISITATLNFSPLNSKQLHFCCIYYQPESKMFWRARGECHDHLSIYATVG